MSINIKTTLGICPRTKLREKLIVQRGANAEISYSLLDKGVSLSILEQATFAFKQRKEIYIFDMFRYLMPTTDTEIDTDKVYYKNIVPVAENSLQCTAELVANPVENPSSANYFEEVTRLTSGQNGLYYFLDPHFSIQPGLNSDYILFTLFSEDTAAFLPTPRGADIKFEVTLRLNTDEQEEFSNRDTIIIDDTQPSLIVKDSLYSQADGLVVNIRPDNTASTQKVVRK